MKENVLRTYHRRIGITVAVFVIIQALTGLLFSIDTLVPGLNLGSIADPVHFGGGIGGAIYRIVLALGLFFMAVTGSLIFGKMRRRALSAAPTKTQPPVIS